MKLSIPILGIVGGAALILAGILGAHFFDQGWGGSTFHLGMSNSEVVAVDGTIILVGSLIIALAAVVLSRVRHKFITTVKFVVGLFLMTIVCTIGWEVVAGELYDCTDPGFIDFLSPGDWIHSWPGHPFATVEQIVHGRSMSEPDTIKQGWSVTGLWCLWFAFVGVSLAVSIFLSRKPWFSSPAMTDCSGKSPAPTAGPSSRSCGVQADGVGGWHHPGSLTAIATGKIAGVDRGSSRW